MMLALASGRYPLGGAHASASAAVALLGRAALGPPTEADVRRAAAFYRRRALLANLAEHEHD